MLRPTSLIRTLVVATVVSAMVSGALPTTSLAATKVLMWLSPTSVVTLYPGTNRDRQDYLVKAFDTSTNKSVPNVPIKWQAPQGGGTITAFVIQLNGTRLEVGTCNATDASGIARATFVANRNFGTFEVKAQSQNSADCSSGTDGPFGSVTQNVIIKPAADLAITLTDSPDPVQAGSPLTYTITAQNSGPSPATNVNVNAGIASALSSGVRLLSATPSTLGASCTGTLANLSCAIGSLAVSGTATVSVVVQPTRAATITAIAAVTATEDDLVPGNNSATQDTIVRGLTGVATVDGATLLTGARVELYSGTALVATTTADSVTAVYFFGGVAPGSYTLHVVRGTTIVGIAAVVPDPPILDIPLLSAPIELSNSSWPSAFGLDSAPSGPASCLPTLPQPGAVCVQEHIVRQGQSRWFKFAIKPGEKVIVKLSNLPVNYDLALFKDILAAYNALTNPQTTQDLVLLTAQFAADAFSADAFSADAFSADAFSADAFSADAFSADAFSADAFSADAFSADAFSADAFSADAFSADAFSADAFSADAFSPVRPVADAFSADAFSEFSTLSPRAFANAQSRSLLAVSALNGTSNELIARNVWNNEGHFYVRVGGRSGAFSLAAPFHLEVVRLPGKCNAVAPIASSIASTITPTAGNYKTIIIKDAVRTLGTASDISTLHSALNTSPLNTFAARLEVAGVVVDVGVDARVAAANAQADLNPECPFAKNLVAAEIKKIIDRYWALNPLEYVVLVGDDQTIPFFRERDDAGLANEQNFVPPVRDATPSQASLRLGYVLSQDRYGSRFELSLTDRTFPVTELAIGRLVETASEITQLLNAYFTTQAGGVTPITTAALVTGYDFFADAAVEIKKELDLGFGIGKTADALITPRDVPPGHPSAWTADQLRALLLGSRHDVVFLAGHFSASSALAADWSTRFFSSEVAASAVDLRNVVVFSLGCHAGYNTPDRDGIPFVTPEPDFPKAFARKGAAIIAGTGYQYGDTDFIEYGERLYLEFSRQLRTGSGPVTIGKALVAAKRVYLNATVNLRGIHQKTLLASTLFGVPHLGVNMPGQRLQPTNGAANVTPTPYQANPGLTLGLQRADFVVTPSLTVHTVPLRDPATNTPVVATYLSGTNGVVSNPGEPVLPLEVRDVTVVGTVLRGVGFRGGPYTDVGGIRPLTGAAATEIRPPHVPFSSQVFFPIRTWGVKYFEALRDGSTFLVVTPAQFVSASETGTLREFGPGPMTFRLFYSNNVTTYQTTNPSAPNTPSLAAGPSILGVSGVPNSSSGVDFSVLVAGDPSAGVQEVWITYTATSGPLAGQWQSLDLTRDPTNTVRWTGTLALPTGQAAGDVRYIVQAVNGVGIVTLATNLGVYYVPAAAVLAGSPKRDTSLGFVSAPTSVSYRESITVKARLAVSQTGAPLVGGLVTFGLGAARRQAATDTRGVATAELAVFQTPGDYDITASFDESADLLGAFASAPLNVTKRETQLALTPPPSVTTQYSDPTPFVATLSDTSILQRKLREQGVFFVVSGTSTAGASLSFATSIVTDFLGRAPLGIVPLPTGTYTVTAYFGGTINLGNGPCAPSSCVTIPNDRYVAAPPVSASLQITQEDTRVTYTGPFFVSTTSSTTSTATVPLSTTVRDISVTPDAAGDKAPGDISTATVTFVDRSTNAPLCSSPVTLVNPSDKTVGTAACTWTANIGTSNSVAYTIGTVVGQSNSGNYLRDNPVDNVVVTVSKPLNNFVTGGGYIVNSRSAAGPGGEAGGRTNFGFNAKKTSSGLQGNANVIVRSDGRVFQIRSNAITALSASANASKGTGAASFSATATIRDLTGPSASTIDSTATLRVVMHDNGEPGRNDTIGITIWTGTALWFSNSWNVSTTAEQELDGGNLQVR